MPLFYFVSGLLYKKYKYGTYFVRKVKYLYVPFVLIEVVFLILHNLYVHIGFYNSISNLKMGQLYGKNEYLRALLDIVLFDNFDLMLAPLWFVASLFFVCLIYRALDRRNASKAILCLGLFLWELLAD